MPRYRITDSDSGRTLLVEGDAAPTESEAAELFATAPEKRPGPEHYALDPGQQTQVASLQTSGQMTPTIASGNQDFTAAMASDAMDNFAQVHHYAAQKYQQLQEIAPEVFGESPNTQTAPEDRTTGLIPTVGKALANAGRLALALPADLGQSLGAGAVQLPNTSQVLSEAASAPTPLPTELATDRMNGGGRLVEKGAESLAKMVPALAASYGLAAAGVSPALAAAAPMGFDPEGNIDPIGAVIAAGLPGVSKAGEELVAAQLAKLPMSHVVAEVLSQDPVRLKGKVVQKLGGLEISNDTFRKYLEAGGGALAANTYLAAAQAPGILALPPEQRKQAILDAVASNAAMSLLAFSSRPGESLTLKNLQPKLAELWRQTMPRPPMERGAVQLEGPAEEGAPVPPQEDFAPQSGAEPQIYVKPSEPVIQPEPVKPEPKSPALPSGDQQRSDIPGTDAPAPNAKGAGGEGELGRLPDPAAPAPDPGGMEPPTPTPLATPKPEPAPVPLGVENEDGVVLGRSTYIVGANGLRVPARYAWMPLDKIQASHYGDEFATNPAFAPLVNTRNYAANPEEKTKVILGRKNWNGEIYTVNTKGAAGGPIMVAPGSDRVYRALGGNGRKLMMDGLSPSQRNEFGKVQDEESAVFGLPARPSDRHILVRLLSPMDVATPAGVAAANQLVDALNPSEGLIESTASIAQNDAVKVPIGALREITPETGPGLLKQWVAGLIGTGVLDRNTRTRLLNSDAEVQDYAGRLLTQAAYRTPVVVEMRMSRYTLKTVSGLIDGATPLLLNLRAIGTEAEPVANAFGAMIQRVGEYQKQYPDKKLNAVFQAVADQGEMRPDESVKLAQQLAMLLARDVEFFEGKSVRGQPVRRLDEEETARNFKGTLEQIAKSVRQWEREGGAAASVDIFGQSRSLLEIIRDQLKVMGMVPTTSGGAMAEDVASYGPDRGRSSWRLRPDEALDRGDLVELGGTVQGYQPGLKGEFYSLKDDGKPGGPDPRVKRYKELMRQRQAGRALSQAQENELTGIEQALGQQFIAQWNEIATRPEPKADTRAEIEARQKARLIAGTLETQQGMFDNPGQMAFFDDSAHYLPGLEQAGGKAPKTNEPKFNYKIEGPLARSERGNRQLRLDGLQPEGHGKQSGARVRKPNAGVKPIVTARAELVPARTKAGHFADFPNLAERLYAHQIDGVNRILDAWAAGKNFGLFDGTGAGKTSQLLAAAHMQHARSGQPVLIVTERQAIIDDAFAKDAERLGVTLWQYDGQKPTPQQGVLMATIFDVANGKIEPSHFESVIFDEAHNLRNADSATRSHLGMDLVNRARRVVFATATPMDTPQQLFYLKSLLNASVEQELESIGIHLTYRTEKGRTVPYFRTLDGLSQLDIEDRLENLFDGMYRRGQAIKREVPLDNLSVVIKRAVMTPENHAEVAEVMAAAQQEYERRGVPSHMVKGLVMMVGRQAMEKYKVQTVLDMTREALAAGKKVLIFGERVQNGMWVQGGGLSALSVMLEQRHGPGSVGRLFGGDTSAAGRQYRAGVMEAYTHGDMKILVAHPEEGGTGINADDIYGDAPRLTIIMTPPFSALRLVQNAGRTNRLTTQSKAEMALVLTNHRVDTWNMDITLRKLKNLKASVKGDVGQLEPKNIVYDKARNRLGTDAQTEFDFFSGLSSLGQLDADLPRPTILGGLPFHIPELSTLKTNLFAEAASLVRQQILEHGKLDIRGQMARTPEQVAALMQAFRLRQMEIFHWIMVKGGQVVGHYAVTTRQPSATVAWVTNDMEYIRTEMKRLGADGYFIAHNHPSGIAIFSAQDESTTHQLANPAPPGEFKRANYVPGFKGHVVINHRTYSFIDDKGKITTRTLPGSGPDPLLQPATHSGLNQQVGNGVQLTSVDVANWGWNWMKSKPKQMTLLMVDARGRSLAVTDLDVMAALQVPYQDLVHDIRAMAQRVGAVQAFGLFSGNHGPTMTMAKKLIGHGVLSDVFADGGLPLKGTMNPSAFTHPASHSFGVNNRGQEPQRLAEDEAGYQPADESTFSTRGLYRVQTPVTPGSVPQKMKVALGGMQHVKPVEMPELVKLAKELTGKLPQLKKMRALGTFTAEGKGLITIDPRRFANPIEAAKTLAHEIGHAGDYLPQGTMVRGNVMGRLYSLNHFLKNTYGGDAVKNKEYREELLGVTRYWKPYDPATSSRSYVAYRESSVELYADALSVLLNSPGLLEKMAPKFYKTFWEELDRKPAVREALFGLQDFLAKGKVPVIEARRDEIRQGFERGEALFKAAVEERRTRAKDFSGFLTALDQALGDRFAPIVRRANKVSPDGGITPAKGDIRGLLEELQMRDVLNLRFARAVDEGVRQPLEEAGLDLTTLGEYMLYQRIFQGDRAGLANPGGTTPMVARQHLMKMRVDLGLDPMTVLDAAAKRFHGLVYGVMKEAVEAGVINKEVFDSTVTPNKDFYAAFVPLKYVEDYVPPGIKKQIGTLDNIANPFISTVLKTFALQNAILWNTAKRSTVEMLQRDFANEISPALLRGTYGNQHPIEKPDAGLLRLLENGTPKWFYVDPFIGEAFDTMHPGTSNKFVRMATALLDKPFREFVYPLIIDYNPGFMLFLSPVRDFMRGSRNLRALGIKGARTKLLADYWQGFKDARARFTGDSRGIVRELEANFAIGTPFDLMTNLDRPAEDAWQNILASKGLVSKLESNRWLEKYFIDPVQKVLRPFDVMAQLVDKTLHAGGLPESINPAHGLVHPLDSIEFNGMSLVLAPKIAAYRILRKQGLQPRPAAAAVRNYIGLPNVYRKGTWHLVPRACVPFWNVFTQSWRDDLRLMTSPKTRSGWWWHFLTTEGGLAVLKGLAAAGLLGAALKELMDGISEYQKTNYNVIPLGYTLGGDYGRRVVYARLPLDPTARMASGVLYKLTQLLGERPDQYKIPKDLFAFGAEEFPTLNPTLSVAARWADYGMNIQPRDAHTGQTIVNDRDWRIGKLDSLAPMFNWTAEQSGVMNLVRYDPKATTTWATTVSAIPGLNRVLQTSDYGYQEKQRAAETAEQRERDKIFVSLPKEVQSLYQEYWTLQRLKDGRTAPQEIRFEDLNQWYNSTYRPGDEAIRQAAELKLPGAAAAARVQLGQDSRYLFRR